MTNKKFKGEKREKLKYRLYQDKTYCGICKELITIKQLYTHEITIDHIKPRYYGGTDDYSNLQLAHHTCNKQKGHQHPNELQSKVTPPVFPSGVEETDNNE